MNKEYTIVRKIYAWVGFAAIVFAGYSLLSGDLWAESTECTTPQYFVPYEPILSELEEPLQAILATSTSAVLETVDFVEENEIVETIYGAQITGYNTVIEQTDSTPCIAADGSNICGRYDAVACPTSLPLGTNVMIYGRVYECVDRTHDNFDGRFDINCNKDFKCPAAVTDIADVHVLK